MRIDGQEYGIENGITVEEASATAVIAENPEQMQFIFLLFHHTELGLALPMVLYLGRNVNTLSLLEGFNL